MHFNVYLDQETAERLAKATVESNESRNAIIRKAIALWLDQKQAKIWPDEILNFKGVNDYPAFESSRNHLRVAEEDPFG